LIDANPFSSNASLYLTCYLIVFNAPDRGTFTPTSAAGAFAQQGLVHYSDISCEICFIDFDRCLPFIGVQELQRVVDAIVLAPHVKTVNGRQNIPLGNSNLNIRRAMYDAVL
jgi:hypothetical protein